jgi:hypothetical protein
VLLFKEISVKECVVLLEQPTQSPDPTPCDFFLYRSVKNHLMGSHFETVEENQNITTVFLYTVQED